MTWFFRGVEFFRSFLTSSERRTAFGKRKDLGIYTRLLLPACGYRRLPAPTFRVREGRSNLRASMLAILGLLVPMTMVAPVYAEYFYTAPQYNGWVLAGKELRGTFASPPMALQNHFDPSCVPKDCGHTYVEERIGPNTYQWDGYWQHPAWASPQYLSSAIPLLSCPPNFKLGEFLSTAYRSIHLGYALPEHQKYNAAGLGTASPGYAVCFRNSIATNPSQDRAPGPPPDGSCSAVGNPCDAATGNKYEHEIDYDGDGVSALRFERYYNSVPTPAGLFGAKWRSNFDRRVIVPSVTENNLYQFPDNYTMARLGMQSPTIRSMAIERPDGKVYWFSQWAGGAWQSEPDIDGTLSSTSTGWVYSMRDGVTETYDGSGRLTAISNRNGLTQTLSYDAAGKLIRVIDSFGRSLNFGYEQSGRLQTLTDPAGQITQYGYDSNGNLARIDYADGTGKLYHYEDTRFPEHLTGISHIGTNGITTRYSTYGYTDAGLANLTEHAGGIGRFTLSYDYSNQTTVTDAIGKQERMNFIVRSGAKLLSSRTYVNAVGTLVRQYDSVGRVTCSGDRDGRATKYTYTTSGQLASKTEGLNGGSTCGTDYYTAARTTTYQYLSQSLDLPTVIESPSIFGSNKARIAIVYSGNLPTSITQSGYTPSGTTVSRSITLGYNAYGQVTSIDGPRTDVGDVTTITYYECNSGGACGQIRSIANAAGHTTTFDSYDAAGRLLDMTDPNGLKTSYQYDARGRVRIITQTPANGSPRVSEYRYTAAGDVAFAVFPDGRTLTYEYNAARLLTAVTDNLGNRIAYGYDLKGNRTAEHTYDSSGTLQRQIDIAYEARNNVSQINRGGSITKFVTDAVGNITNEYDPNTSAVNGYSSTRNTYDRMGRLLTTIDKVYGYTYFSYDINSNLKQVKTPNSATTSYAYDDLGNLLSETSPDRGTTTYTYDTAGNVRTVTDARGITATYSYDALNRISAVRYDNDSENITYAYDACSNGIGRLCTVQDAAGASDYAYDGFGNVVTHRRTELGWPIPHAIHSMQATASLPSPIRTVGRWTTPATPGAISRRRA
jgi:YD repeat-containing protein